MLSYIHKIYMPHVFTHTIKRKSTFMTDAIVHSDTHPKHSELAFLLITMFCPKTYGTGLETSFWIANPPCFTTYHSQNCMKGKSTGKSNSCWWKVAVFRHWSSFFPTKMAIFFRVLRPRPEAPLRVSACGAPAAPAEALGEPAQAGQKGPKNWGSLGYPPFLAIFWSSLESF